MQVEGLEPSRGYPRQILSLLRLPFRHTCNNAYLITYRERIQTFYLTKYIVQNIM